MVYAAPPGIQTAFAVHCSPRCVCPRDAARLVTPRSVWTRGAVRRRTSVVQRVAAKVRNSAAELDVVILALHAVMVRPAAIRTRYAVAIHVVIKVRNVVVSMGINAVMRLITMSVRNKHSTRIAHISLTP